MDKIENIEYSVFNYDSTYGSTRLEINIKGANINYVILNTIRRSVLSYIPNYAFTQFNFKKNTSIFNNNYLKLRISNLPVWGIENTIEIFNDEKKLETIQEIDYENDEDDIEIEENININSSSLEQLTMYVDYTSDKKEIITVTTDNAKFYFGQSSIANPYNIPIPLVKLQPNQTIQFSVVTTVGIEAQNSIYSIVSVCFYKQIKENEFMFILESRTTITEKKIIEIAIINIINKLKNIAKMIPKEQISVKGEILIENEDHTIGNLLTTGLQQHKKVKFAGYNVPHLLENNVKIHYELINDSILINDIINDVVKYYIDIYSILIKKNKQIELN